MHMNIETHYFLSGITPDDKSILRRIGIIPRKGKNASISPSAIYEAIAKLSNTTDPRKHQVQALVLLKDISAMMKAATAQTSTEDTVFIDLS